MSNLIDMVEKYREIEDRKLEIPRAIDALKRASLDFYSYKDIPEIKKLLDNINNTITVLHKKKKK